MLKYVKNIDFVDLHLRKKTKIIINRSNNVIISMFRKNVNNPAIEMIKMELSYLRRVALNELSCSLY